MQEYDYQNEKERLYADSKHNVTQNFHNFCELVEKTKKLLDVGNLEASAVYAQIAAHYAWRNHTGLFASRKLEMTLSEIGLAMAPEETGSLLSYRWRANPKYVLHVVSQAYNTGGHTRLIWRWIQQDSSRTHSVAFTRQGSIAVPEQLERAVKNSNGRTYLIDRNNSSLRDRASFLRNLGKVADQIILHLHPDDVVPSLAFADRRKIPPITLINHADHVFWLGMNISDVVANLRDSGRQLAEQRRGISIKKSVLLPLPLTKSEHNLSRTEAKQRLGVDTNSILLLSIASPYKYTSFNNNDFVNTLSSIVASRKDVSMFVIGPSDNGVWQEARIATEGRLQALGRRNDLPIFYQAADIYIDSFPFSSLTAAFEAGLYGSPILTYFQFSDESNILSSDDIALNDIEYLSRNIETFRDNIYRFIDDTEHRLKVGEIIRARFEESHIGKGWVEYIRNIYQKAVDERGLNKSWDTVEQLKILELDMLLDFVFRKSGFSKGVDASLQVYMRFLPVNLRIRIWCELRRRNIAVPSGLLLSDWLGTKIERLTMGIK